MRTRGIYVPKVEDHARVMLMLTARKTTNHNEQSFGRHRGAFSFVRAMLLIAISQSDGRGGYWDARSYRDMKHRQLRPFS